MAGRLRPLRVLGQALLLTLVVGVALISSLVGTTAGGRLALRAALSFAELPVAFDRFDGRLAGFFSLSGVSARLQGVTATVERLQVSWRPVSLLRRELDVISLDATGVSLVLEPTVADSAVAERQPQSAADSLLRLPFSVAVGRATLDGVELLAPDAFRFGSGRVEVGGTDDSYRVAVIGNISAGAVDSVALTLAGSGNLRSLSLDSASVKLLRGGLLISGSLSWLPRLEWQLALRASDIEPALLLDDTTSLAGRVFADARSSGTPDSFELDLVGRFDSPRLPRNDISLHSKGSVSGAAIDSLVIQTLGGRVGASGVAGWRDQLSWDLALELDSLRPGLAMADPDRLPGWLSLSGRTSGGLVSGARWPDGRIQIDTISGVMRGRELSAVLSAQAADSRVDVPLASLRWGGASIEASGSWGDSLMVDAAIGFPNLALVHPDAGGSLELDLSGSGTAAAPSFRATVDAAGLSYDSLRVDFLNGVFEIQSDSATLSKVTLAARGISRGSLVVDSLKLFAEGTRSNHSVMLGLAAPRGGTALELVGGLEQGNWRGRIAEWEIAPTTEGIPSYRLVDDAPLQFSSELAVVDSLCLEGSGKLCLDASWRSPTSAALHLSVDDFQLNMLEMILDSTWTVAGTLDASVEASVDSAGLLSLSAFADPSPIEVRRRMTERVRLARIEFERAVIEAGDSGFAGSTLLTVSDSTGSSLLRVEGSVTLPEFRSIRDSLGPLALSALLKVEADDLAPLDALSPSLSEVSGRLRADLSFGGTLAAPSSSGLASLEVSRAVISDLGITLNDVVLEAEGRQDGSFSLSGSARSGEGVLELRGRSPARPSREDPATLTVTGRGFQAIKTTEVDVVVSPDLRIEAVVDSVAVSGTVEIPRASIELVEVPATAVPVSPDVVMVDSAAGQDRSGPITVTSNIRLVLGDDVRFSGFFFTSKVEGTLALEDRPHLPSTAAGELRLVGGRYRAYGQDLQIERGRFRFNGPLDNPGLDVRAFREARDRTIAGLDITGTLQAPEVSIWSNPPMSQSQAMSYLMLGRPMESDSDRSALADAAAAIGLQSTSGLTQGVGRDLGLDEVGIDASEGVDRAAFVAGKYLSPKLYVSYGVGLFEQINTFRARYDLSRHISVQAESGRQNAADILFTFERK